MAYTPINASVYVAAYVGALEGITSVRGIGSYPGLAQVCGAYAQQFDTTWGLRATSSLDLDTIENESAGIFEERGAIQTSGAKAPTQYVGLVGAVITIVNDVRAYFAAQGIVPPPVGGLPEGAGGILVGPWSARPAASAANRNTIYQSTVGHFPAVSDGTLWRPLVGGLYCMAPLPASALTLVNIGSGSFSDSQDALFYQNAVDPSSPLNWRGGGVKLVDYFPGFVKGNDCWFESILLDASGTATGPTSFTVFGIFMLEQSSGKLVTLEFAWDNTTHVMNAEYDTWHSTTSRNIDTAFSASSLDGNGPLKFRLKVAGGLLHAQATRWSNFATDEGWHDYLSPQPLAANFDVGPDFIGVGSLSVDAAISGYVYHWNMFGAGP